MWIRLSIRALASGEERDRRSVVSVLEDWTCTNDVLAKLHNLSAASFVLCTKLECQSKLR